MLWIVHRRFESAMQRLDHDGIHAFRPRQPVRRIADNVETASFAVGTFGQRLVRFSPKVASKRICPPSTYLSQPLASLPAITQKRRHQIGVAFVRNMVELHIRCIGHRFEQKAPHCQVRAGRHRRVGFAR